MPARDATFSIPKLIATDLDGTLLNSAERISPRNRAVLERATASGVQLVLASGRPARWMLPVVEQLHIRPLCVAANGAIVYNSATGEILRSHILDSQTMENAARVCVDILGDHIGFGVERFHPDIYAPEEEIFRVTHNFAHLWDESHFSSFDLEKVIEKPAVKLLVRDEKRSAESMYSLLKHELSGVHITYSISEGLLELSYPHVTKVTGLAEVAKDYGVDSKDIIAFGDMPNDIDMLSWAGCGVAMGNAHPILKNYANFITKINDEDGVAHILEQWW